MIDYHIHSNFSDGEKSVEEIIALAKEKGITSIAITDHFDLVDKDHLHNQKTVQELKTHFENIRYYEKKYGIDVFCGIETCSDDKGKLNIPAECKNMCDIIITSAHYFDFNGDVKKGEYFNDSYWKKYCEKLLLLAEIEGDILGHPEGYLPINPMLEDDTTYEQRQEIRKKIAKNYFNEKFIDALGEKLVKNNKAYEIHGASNTPREWVVQKLHQKGVTFSIGSDAHAINILGENQRAVLLQKKYNLKIFSPRKNKGEKAW